MRLYKFSPFLVIALAVLLVTLSSTNQPNAHAKPLPSLIERSSLQSPPMSSPFTIIARPDNRFFLDPKAAYNSNRGEFMVVWIERTGAGESTIAGRRVSLNGHAIAEDFVIKPEKKDQHNYQIDLVYVPAHDQYWAVYAQENNNGPSDIWVKIINWDGRILSGSSVDIDSDDDDYPDIVYNSLDDRILVVYRHHISSDRDDIIAKYAQAENVVWSNEVEVAGGNNLENETPDAAYNWYRNNYLIAYQKETGSHEDIAGKIVSSDLSSIGSEISITPLGSTPDQDDVKLSAGQDEYLAVWVEQHSTTKAALWGRRISGDGTLHPYIKFAQDDDWRRYLPATAYGDGGRYLTSWRDIEGSNPYNIGGYFLRQGMDNLEGDRFYIEHNQYSQDQPSVACGYLIPCLVAYTDYYPYEVPTEFSIRGRLVGQRYTMLPFVIK